MVFEITFSEHRPLPVNATALDPMAPPLEKAVPPLYDQTVFLNQGDVVRDNHMLRHLDIELRSSAHPLGCFFECELALKDVRDFQ